MTFSGFPHDSIVLRLTHFRSSRVGAKKPRSQVEKVWGLGFRVYKVIGFGVWDLGLRQSWNTLKTYLDLKEPTFFSTYMRKSQ